MQYLTWNILKRVMGNIIFISQTIYHHIYLSRHLWTPTLPMPAICTGKLNRLHHKF